MLRTSFQICLISLLLSLLGCVITDKKSETSNQPSDDEFNRLTSCVNGRLPMEIQFVIQDNPSVANGETISLEAIDKIIEQLDSQVSSLLAASMVRAWDLASSKYKIGSTGFIGQLQVDFPIEIAERAPKAMQVEYCGDKNSVGGAVLASIAGYFSRAARLQDGSKPIWLKSFGVSGDNKGTSIIMMAVGLRLAGKDFDPAQLAIAIASQDG